MSVDVVNTDSLIDRMRDLMMSIEDKLNKIAPLLSDIANMREEVAVIVKELENRGIDIERISTEKQDILSRDCVIGTSA